MNKRWCVYILANNNRNVLYIGMTSNLPGRIFQHKSHADPESFSAKYRTGNLVYAEPCDSFEDARLREKRLKDWHHQWKVRLIEKTNPEWKDLSEELCA